MDRFKYILILLVLSLNTSLAQNLPFSESYGHRPELKLVKKYRNDPERVENKSETLFIFDNYGNNIERVTFYKGKKDSKSVYRYNKENKLTQSLDYNNWIRDHQNSNNDHWDSTTVLINNTYKYDSKGNLTKIIHEWMLEPNQYMIIEEFLYDENNQIIHEKSTYYDLHTGGFRVKMKPMSDEIDENQEFPSKTVSEKVITYNVDEIEIKNYQDGELATILTKTKKDGFVIAEELVDDNGKFIRRTIHEYDKNGNIINSVVEGDSNITVFGEYYDNIGADRKTFNYDQRGNLIESKFYYKGNLYNVFKWEYEYKN